MNVPNLKQAVPFFGVKDIEASLRFYVDGLGFEVTERIVDIVRQPDRGRAGGRPTGPSSPGSQ